MDKNKSLRTLQIACLIIGVLGVFVSVSMNWQFGKSISLAHAWGLSLVAAFSAIFWPLRHYAVHHFGAKGAAIPLLLIGVMLTGFKFLGDIGYTFGMRDKQQVQAEFQGVKFVDNRDLVTDKRATLATMRAHEATLNKQLEATGGWSTTIDPHGLAQEIANMEGDYIFKRSKGCANVTLPDSRKFCDKLTALKTRKSGAEELKGTRDQIAATEKVIADLVEKSAGTPPGHSTAKVQNTAFARIGLAFFGDEKSDAMSPDQKAMLIADYIIALAMAVAATMLDPVAFYFAFLSVPMAATMAHVNNKKADEPATDEGTQSTQPVEINIPVSVNTERIAENNIELPPRRIGRVNSNKLAHNIMQRAGNLRAAI